MTNLDDAIKELDEAAKRAVDRIDAAGERAQEMIVTTACVSNESQADRRQINGSFQWPRADRIVGNNFDMRIRLLEVGQAKREEQIITLLREATDLNKEIDQIKSAMAMSSRECSERDIALREAIVEVKETLLEKFEANRSKILWQFVLIMATLITTIVFIIINKFVQV